MSLESKDKWRPTGDIKSLRQRAKLYKQIRSFFDKLGVLEVSTPLLAQHTVTSPYIDSFTVNMHSNKYYLQTSPEYAMKRLLAAGSGDIFEITSAFRVDESGGKHNPEFTMLEWYRLNFDLYSIMNEVESLMCMLLGEVPVIKTTYVDIFLRYLNVNPITSNPEKLKNILCENSKFNIKDNLINNADKDDILNLIMSEIIEPRLPSNQMIFIYKFPASMAYLAKLCPQDRKLALRFEVIFNGLELVNGYVELTDSKEQYERFELDNEIRKKQHKPVMSIDTRLIAALEYGMPECAGVAIGLDRILMLQQNISEIKKVMTFDINSA